MKLDLENKRNQITKLETEISNPEIWLNPKNAQEKVKKLADLKKVIHPWVVLKTQVEDISELIDLGDDDLLDEFESQIQQFESNFLELRKQLLFDGEFDDGDAIVRITSGVGGTDAQDVLAMG